MTHHNTTIPADSLALAVGLAYEISLHTEALTRLLSYAADDDTPLTNAQIRALLEPLRADLEAFGDHAAAVHQSAHQPLHDAKEVCTGCNRFDPREAVAVRVLGSIDLLNLEEALNAVHSQINAVSMLTAAHEDYEIVSVLLDAPILSLSIIGERLEAIRKSERAGEAA